MKKKVAMVMALAAVVSMAGCAADNNSGRGERGGKPAFHKAEFHGDKHHMQGKGGIPRSMKRLNLSEEQKQKIQAILAAHQPQHMANQDWHNQRMKQHDELVQASQFDETKARQMINERNQRHAEMQLQHLKMQHAIFQVLTPEQQKQWQERGGRFQRGGNAPQTN